jgi:anti-sigma-K factor RskA
MSGEDQVLMHERCAGDAAAYALGALEPVEVEAFERHLQRCVVCAEELGRFRQVADTLATSPPQYAVPAGLRSRVIGSASSERRRSGASRRRRLRGPRLIASHGPRLATALAVALVAAVVVITTGDLGGSSGARVLSASVVDSPGSAQVRLVDGRAELIVRDFPAPRAGLIYEVWLERRGRAPAPTRVLFSVTAHGAGDIGVPAPLNGVNEIMVSPEPDGGSDVPTHAAVIVARLS